METQKNPLVWILFANILTDEINFSYSHYWRSSAANLGTSEQSQRRTTARILFVGKVSLVTSTIHTGRQIFSAREMKEVYCIVRMVLWMFLCVRVETMLLGSSAPTNRKFVNHFIYWGFEMYVSGAQKPQRIHPKFRSGGTLRKPDILSTGQISYRKLSQNDEICRNYLEPPTLDPAERYFIDPGKIWSSEWLR